MNSLLTSIHYSPVKSLSFLNIKIGIIKKDIGLLNDRIFSFSRNIDLKKSKLVEKFPNQRKLNYFLTLKNSPFLNKYKFSYDNNQLTLYKNKNQIISISSEDSENYYLLCDKLLQFEKSLLGPIFLLRNKDYPFFDTTHSNNISNSLSLININSIKDLEKKTNKTIEFERFRGNLYFQGVKAWEERNWLNKIVKINNIAFKVEKHIARCSATNLKPNTDSNTINLPMNLKKYFNHIDLGIYLNPLEDGIINVGDRIMLDE